MGATFWDITPCSPSKVKRIFEQTDRPIHLKMEAIYFSETLVDFKWNTRRYVPLGNNQSSHPQPWVPKIIVLKLSKRGFSHRSLTTGLCLLLVSVACSTSFSTLTTESLLSSQTSVNYHNARRQIPCNNTLLSQTDEYTRRTGNECSQGIFVFICGLECNPVHN
jgi:hypothetical protein